MDQIFIANASYLGSYGNALAGEEATDYLYEMGHRRIAYFGISNAMLFSAERRREAERPHFVYFFRYSRGVIPKCALNARLK